MITYNVIFTRNKVYHGNVIKAKNRTEIKKYFGLCRPKDKIFTITKLSEIDLQMMGNVSIITLV